MSLIVSGGGYSFQVQSTDGIWSWTIKAINTQGLGQTYEVRDIMTPWGPIAGVMIPIPGDVLLAMADSLVDFQQQLAPQLALTGSSPTVFNVIITEGDPNIAAGIVSVINSGAYGSYMVVTATPSVSWLQPNPTYIGDLGKNNTGNFNIGVLTSTLLSASSPYHGVVNLQDNRSTPTVIPITVSVTVNPRPVIDATPLTLAFTYSLLTGTDSGAQQIVIQNSGPANSTLNFSLSRVHNSSNWLDFIPTSGGPLASGSSTIITCSIVHTQVPHIPGLYQDSIRIASQNASNSPVDVAVTLTVS